MSHQPVGSNAAGVLMPLLIFCCVHCSSDSNALQWARQHQ